MGYRMDVDEAVPARMEPRMAEILDAVRSVFAAKGFEKASMQDLAQAAGMSAGNFYRYFTSKDAIVEALVERDLDILEGKFSEFFDAGAPVSLLREGLSEEIDLDDPEGAAIWTEILAAAKRRPEVAVLLSRLEARVVGNLLDVFARLAGIDGRAAAARYTAHATMILMLVQSVRLRRAQDDGFDRSPLRALVMRTLEGVLAEVSGSGDTPAQEAG